MKKITYKNIIFKNENDYFFKKELKKIDPSYSKEYNEILQAYLSVREQTPFWLLLPKDFNVRGVARLKVDKIGQSICTIVFPVVVE